MCVHLSVCEFVWGHVLCGVFTGGEKNTREGIRALQHRLSHTHWSDTWFCFTETRSHSYKTKPSPWPHSLFSSPFFTRASPTSSDASQLPCLNRLMQNKVLWQLGSLLKWHPLQSKFLGCGSVQLLSRVRLSATPWTAARLPCPSPTPGMGCGWRE